MSKIKELDMGKTKYNVYLEDEFGRRFLFTSFDNYDEALDFCQKQNYCYTDENGYVWDLDLVEINA